MISFGPSAARAVGARRIAVVGVLWLTYWMGAVQLPAAEEAPVPREVLPLSSDLRIVVQLGRDIELQCLAGEGDDHETIARRVAGDEADAAILWKRNGERAVEAGDWVRVPLEVLSEGFRTLVLRGLFPRDHHDGEDWVHVARDGELPTYDEGLWQVARWYAGSGAAFEELMRVNGLNSPELRKGQAVRVPANLLHYAFRSRMRSDDGTLEFDKDELGPYAAYRLRQGEALYSSVVVRFTGRTGADDVRSMAEELGTRSRILDPRDIPVNWEVKIPLDLLEPEFLPAGHPRRIEAEAQQAELARVLASRPVAGTRGGLDGVVLVLDPGHGGRDLGTMHNGIWEHDYVYDVACRLKHKIETRSAARVVMTLEDEETGCVPSMTDQLVANQQGTILTSPPFLAKEEGEARIGVNLRWYLANSVYRHAVDDGVDRDRVVFMSLHADSRHPSLRGLMVYVPGAGYRTRTYGHDTGQYRKFKEVREKPRVNFSHGERVRSEAVSRKLADAVVESFRGSDLPIQPYQPVRDKVIRGRSKWVPAVLRGNSVPTKVLVEMVNLSNPEDAALLASALDRDQIAEALLDSLYGYFGEPSPQIASSTAAR